MRAGSKVTTWVGKGQRSHIGRGLGRVKGHTLVGLEGSKVTLVGLEGSKVTLVGFGKGQRSHWWGLGRVKGHIGGGWEGSKVTLVGVGKGQRLLHGWGWE